MACVTTLNTSVLYPDEFFTDPDLATSDLQAQLAALSTSSSEKTQSKQPTLSTTSTEAHERGIHSFTIVAKMLSDDRLKPSKIHQFDDETDAPFAQTLKDVGEIVREYARLWLVPVDGKDSDKVVKAKIEELQSLASVLFGLGGWREGQEFRSDFFL